MKRYNKIVEKEIIRIQPYHLLGVILHSLVIYISFKIPQIIGNILNLLMEETINQEQIIEQAYWLIFYCVIVYIPRTLYRTLYFTTSRKSDTYLRKEVIKNLQKVKPEYFEKEKKGELKILGRQSCALMRVKRKLRNPYVPEFSSVKFRFSFLSISFLRLCRNRL